jgi:hypothetical protein
MVINNQPLKAATRPLAGFGAGAFLCEGSWAGSHAGVILAAPALRWATVGSAASAPVQGDYQPTISTQSEQHMTLIDPVAPGGLGPHPVREPEPV